MKAKTAFPEQPSQIFPETTGIRDATSVKGQKGCRRARHREEQGDVHGKGNYNCTSPGCKDENTTALKE